MTTTPSDEQQVGQVVQAFYDAFNSHEFGRLQGFTTDDWEHINPLGGWTRGREAVIDELKEVHSTFLKGVSDTVEEMSIRFATPDVAVVTVPSRMSTFMTPDGVRYEGARPIRTFVVVRRAGQWLIMHDQNTLEAADPLATRSAVRMTVVRLHRYWFVVDQTLPYGPSGFGVTAWTEDDARLLLRAAIADGRCGWHRGQSAELDSVRVIEDIDIGLLDPRHIIPNMGIVVDRGLWWPRLVRGRAVNSSTRSPAEKWQKQKGVSTPG